MLGDCRVVRAYTTRPGLSCHIRSLHCCPGVAFLGWQSGSSGEEQAPPIETHLNRPCTRGRGSCQEEGVAMDGEQHEGELQCKEGGGGGGVETAQ